MNASNKKVKKTFKKFKFASNKKVKKTFKKFKFAKKKTEEILSSISILRKSTYIPGCKVHK